jgi:CTP synthase
MEIHDTYASLYEALFHASLECGAEVDIVKIDSSSLDKSNNVNEALKDIDGILVPGGFGERGINGMVKAAEWARTNKKPYFGICLGMQIMVIEWARNILNWSDADSTEFTPDTKHPVVSLLDEQVNIKNYGGTMRLGSSETINNENTHIYSAYGEKKIAERHRHRYEFSNRYRDEMINSGLKLAAFTPDGALVECVEWQNSGETGHPWGLGVQFHPEYKSKPMAAAPLFRDFVAAIKKNK